MENINQLLDILRKMGIKGHFKPYREAGTGAVLLHVRRPAAIVDGRLLGSEIDLYGPSTFRVWTNQTRKAKAYAARYGLRLRLLDGECVLYIPAHLADTLLREFGVKVKRTVSDATKARLKATWFKRDTA